MSTSPDNGLALAQPTNIDDAWAYYLNARRVAADLATTPKQPWWWRSKEHRIGHQEHHPAKTNQGERKCNL